MIKAKVEVAVEVKAEVEVEAKTEEDGAVAVAHDAEKGVVVDQGHDHEAVDASAVEHLPRAKHQLKFHSTIRRKKRKMIIQESFSMGMLGSL